MSSDMSRMILKGIAISLLFSLPTVIQGQPRDWDDVSKEELAMQVYPSDSSASAVVLFDKADVTYNNSLEYVMERHIRIKIINEEGYKWATTKITYDDEFEQDISRIRGHTFTLTDDGKIRKHKLDGDDIFEEDLSEDYKKISFTLPALEPGAVLEFKYRKHIGSPYLLPDWEFQREIPVAWSEYNVKIPDWFFYNKMLVGTRPLHISESDPFSDRMTFTFKQRSGFYQVKTKYRNVSLDISGHNNKWVMKDLPAVKELPYMTSVDDYKSKLWIQLTEIRIPRQVPKYFLKSWADVAQELRDADLFGGQLRSRSEYGETVNQLTAGMTDSLSKMKAIYNYVDESMVWDGSKGIAVGEDINDVFEAKKGSGAELNLLMVQLLRDAGLTANPLLLSTRSHGKVIEYFAIANQFNHTITCVEIGDEIYLLDATSDQGSVYILPVEDLNGNGLLVTDATQRWIPLKSVSDTKKRMVFNARITDEGRINGELYASSKGYDASADGLELEKVGAKDYMERILTNHFQNGSIDSFQVEKNYLKKNELVYDLVLRNLEMVESQQSENLLYFNPMFFLRQEENPFSQPEREIPVDFPYVFEKQYVANFVVPDGYSIDQVPEPKVIATPDGSAVLRRLTQVTQNRITVLSKLNIRKETFQPEEYQALREFYSHVVDVHSEQIVLKKDIPSAGDQD